MYTLASDEKVTPIMIYTHNALVRGELVTKVITRVNIWLRMQAQVHYIHVHKAQALMFGGRSPNPLRMMNCFCLFRR